MAGDVCRIFWGDGCSASNISYGGFRVTIKAVIPGGGQALHSAVLKPATDYNRNRLGLWICQLQAFQHSCKRFPPLNDNDDS